MCCQYSDRAAIRISQNIHGDETSHPANGKGAQRSQLLSWRNIALCKLFQCCVAGKASCRVGCLSGRSRYKSLEETADASFLEDDLASMNESTHPWLCRFSVIDPEIAAVLTIGHLPEGPLGHDEQLRFDTLERRDCQQ